jgi:hypothetical protein
MSRSQKNSIDCLFSRWIVALSPGFEVRVHEFTVEEIETECDLINPLVNSDDTEMLIIDGDGGMAL